MNKYWNITLKDRPQKAFYSSWDPKNSVCSSRMPSPQCDTRARHRERRWPAATRCTPRAVSTVHQPRWHHLSAVFPHVQYDAGRPAADQCSNTDIYWPDGETVTASSSSCHILSPVTTKLPEMQQWKTCSDLKSTNTVKTLYYKSKSASKPPRKEETKWS